MNEKNKALPNSQHSERANTNNNNKDNDFLSLLKQEIQSHQENFDENKLKESDSDNLFNVMTANEWIKQAEKRPIPKMLFSEFWHEGEVCILYADTNLGKSILAVQIADSISRGKPIFGFKLEAQAQKVLYFDFELTEKQFQNRYSIDYQNPYIFNNNLFRIEIDPDSNIPVDVNFEDYLNSSIEQVIIEKNAKVLIIDNITFLRTENEKAKDALPLMKQLKALKSKYNLSLLVLAHTPKRDLSKPVTRNDLQGSKMLINFCDSAFAIGESSTTSSIRYIKMIKARNTEILYDADNIIECNICKPDNFLKFEFLSFGKESTHLRSQRDSDKEELESKIQQLMLDEPDLSAYAIAKKLCDDETKFNSFKVKVTRIVNKFNQSH